MEKRIKKEKKMMENGNYEEVISPLQHKCESKDKVVRIVEYGWNLGKLILSIEDGDPYEDGYSDEFAIKFCPYCGYNPSK